MEPGSADCGHPANLQLARRADCRLDYLGAGPRHPRERGLAHIAPGGLGLVLCPERNIIRIFIVRETRPPADCPTLTVSREYCCALAPLCARLSGQKPRQARTTSIGERTDRGVRHRYTSTSVSWLPAIPATG